MYPWEFHRPYPEIMLYAVICIICLCVGGWIFKRYCRNWLSPFLIPLSLVLMSFLMSNLYYGGWAALADWGMHDLRGVINGLAAVGLHQLVTKTIGCIRYRRLKKNSKHKNEQKIVS